MQELGSLGENIVAEYLKKNGFTILTQNYRTRCGEVDIIAQKGDTVAFVEVKTRKKVYFPTSSVVTFGKQKKIIKAAKSFILKHNIIDKVLRFDVATVETINTQELDYNIEYIPNAFYGR